MNTVTGGLAYVASDASTLAIGGYDTVSLWSAGQVVALATQDIGSDLITGGDGTYALSLAGRDTISLGNGNDTIIGFSPTLEPVDQQIVVGGLQGFADLANASNTTTLMTTGRVSEYLHWAALIDVSTGKLEVPGAQTTRAQIASMQAIFHHSSGPLAELDYNANPQSFFAGLFTSDFISLGFHPANANVNMFDLWRSPTGVAAWDAYVVQARAHGMQSIAPIYSPNDVPMPAGWADAQFAPVRAMALYGGAIAIDSPPSFFFAQSAAYQQFIVDEIKWGVANGLRVSVIVSPYTGNTTYLADTEHFVQTLTSVGAIPTQWVAENYDVPVPANYPNRLGSEDQLNTVDNIALWLARNAPTVAQQLPSNNVITVGNGNDRIALAQGDVLHAGAGADTIMSAGRASIVASGGSGTLTLAQADTASVSGGNYRIALGTADTVSLLSGSATVLQGAGTGSAAGNATVTGTASIIGGGQAFSIVGGDGTLVASLGATGGYLQGGTAGGSLLAAGAGAATIQGGAAGDTIRGGSGQAVIATFKQGGDSVSLGSGAATVTLHANDTLYGGSGAATVSDLGNAMIVYGSGSMACNFGSGDTILAAGSQSRVITTPTGSDTISGIGGTGAAIFTGGAGFDVLYAGTGNDVLSLGSGGGQAYAAAGNATLNGGSGSATLVGGAGNTSFFAQQGNVQILAGSGSGIINTGTGSSVVQLQGGHDNITLGTGAVTVAGQGIATIDLTGVTNSADVIRNFSAGLDTLTLHGGLTVASDSFAGGAAVLKLSDGAVISIFGPLVSAMHLPQIST